MKFKKILLLWNYWANLNQTLLKWSLGGPLSKLCPSARTFWLKIEQSWPFEEISIFSNGGHLGYRTALTDTILKRDHLRIISTKFGISTKLCWIDPKVVPFQNCVRQRRPMSKMAAITKNRNFFKWPRLLYFKPESAQIGTVWDHLRIISTKFGWDWLSSFRGEDFF
jgi:hypothetical protein